MRRSGLDQTVVLTIVLVFFIILFTLTSRFSGLVDLSLKPSGIRVIVDGRPALSQST